MHLLPSFRPAAKFSADPPPLPTEKGYDRSIVSPALSDDAPTVPYSGFSSTLLSVDPNKLYEFSTAPTSVIGSSSASSDRDRDPLRPRPYLVPRESTADSLADLRKGGDTKHARTLSAATTNTNTNMSASDVRVATASPSQLGSAYSGDGDAEGEGGAGAGDARLDSLSLGSAIGGSLGLAFSDIGASDVGSNSGEATLPPPYALYFGGGGGGGGGAQTEEA